MQANKKKFRCRCATTSALDIIGDNWSLVIVKQMLIEGKKTFKDFYESDESIASNILSARLKHLEKFGIISKEKLPDNKKTNIYRLTEKGVALAPVIAELAIWGNTHLGEFNLEIENDVQMKKLKLGKEKFVKNIQDNYIKNNIK